MSASYGPVVPLRRQMRIAPWFILGVVAWGLTAGRTPAPTTAPPSATATADIPPSYLAAYQRAARSCPGLAWTVLAGVGKVESDHGRSRLPGVRSGANWAGAAGPMQIGIGGRAGDTWAAYGDGVRAHVYQIGPAARAAARKLCRDGARSDLGRALFAYNCGRPWCRASVGYVNRVRSIARTYREGGDPR